jgi:hypothetical protein
MERVERVLFWAMIAAYSLRLVSIPAGFALFNLTA